MRIINISSDRLLCDPESAVAKRHRAYGVYADMSIIVCTPLGFTPVNLSERVRVYPTNSRSRWLYPVDVVRVAWHLHGDVVTAQNPFELGMIGMVVSFAKRIPLHVQIHTDIFSRQFTRGSLMQRMRILLARVVLLYATRVRVVLERTKDELRECGVRAPVTILPIFVDRAHFESLPRRKHSRFKIALLFVGRLEREKCPEVAIAALERVRREGHDAGLTIVGGGSCLGALRALVREHSLERYVLFMGHQKNLDQFYEEADALLVPSMFEGYGMVIVEALSAGVPVIATDVGIAQEAGAIIAPHDPEQFGEKVVEWVRQGNQKGSLSLMLPESLDVYARAYCADIEASFAHA